MKKIKLTQVQADKVSQLLIEENRLKQEFQKVTGRKTDMVELVLDAQGLSVDELSKIKSYNFSGGEDGSMFIELVEVGDQTPPAKQELEGEQSPPNKKKK